MKNLFLAFAIVALCTTAVNAQTKIEKVVDLNDTAEATKSDRDLADDWNRKVGGIKPYGSQISLEFDINSPVILWQLENIESRVDTGATTQFLIMYTDKQTKKPNARITPENPLNKVDAGVSSGCGCLSVKMGDDDDSDVDPGLLE